MVHARKGAASYPDLSVAEAKILARFKNEVPHSLGPMNDRCAFCGALHWRYERRADAKKNEPHIFSKCCQQGGVNLRVIEEGMKDVPDFFRAWLEGNSKGMISLN